MARYGLSRSYRAGSFPKFFELSSLPLAAHRRALSQLVADRQVAPTWRTIRWDDVVAKYDYDVRGIFLDGTAEDLAVFNRTHPDVLEHTSRSAAYEEQVCGG